MDACKLLMYIPQRVLTAPRIDLQKYDVSPYGAQNIIVADTPIIRTLWIIPSNKPVIL